MKQRRILLASRWIVWYYLNYQKNKKKGKCVCSNGLKNLLFNEPHCMKINDPVEEKNTPLIRKE